MHSLRAPQGDTAMVFFCGVGFTRLCSFSLLCKPRAYFIPERTGAGKNPPKNCGGNKTCKKGKGFKREVEHGLTRE